MEKRGEARYSVRCEVALSVTIVGNSPGELIHGNVVELSTSGMKLSLAESVQFLESLNMHVLCMEPRLQFDAEATVAWIRPNMQSWIVGCNLKCPIPDEAVRKLAKAGVIDRRRHPRHPASHPATARWEASGSDHDVTIRDYSVGGFSITSATPCIDGAALMLTFASGESTCRVYGRVRWQEQQGTEYRIGCSFVDDSDAVLLRTALKPAGIVVKDQSRQLVDRLRNAFTIPRLFRGK